MNQNREVRPSLESAAGVRMLNPAHLPLVTLWQVNLGRSDTTAPPAGRGGQW